MSYKHKTNNNARERPKSSIFPPLVPKSQPFDDHQRQRSSSFDYSFTDGFVETREQLLSMETNGDISLNQSKPNGKVAENEVG